MNDKSVFYYEVIVEDNYSYGGFILAGSFAEAAELIEGLYRGELLEISRLVGYDKDSIVCQVDNARKIKEIFDKDCF